MAMSTYETRTYEKDGQRKLAHTAAQSVHLEWHGWKRVTDEQAVEAPKAETPKPRAPRKAPEASSLSAPDTSDSSLVTD